MTDSAERNPVRAIGGGLDFRLRGKETGAVSMLFSNESMKSCSFAADTTGR
jgi:hypothetical protein